MHSGKIALSAFLLCPLAFIALAPAATASLNGSDSFESCANGAQPTGSFYTYGVTSGGSTNTGCTTAQAADGVKSVQVNSGGGFLLNTEVCHNNPSTVNNGQTIGFSFRVSALPTAGNNHYMGVTKNAKTIGAATRFVGIQIDSAGAVRAASSDGAVGSNANSFVTIAANAWNTFSIGGIQCGSGGQFTVNVNGAFDQRSNPNMGGSGGAENLDTVGFSCSIAGCIASTNPIYVDVLSVSGLTATVTSSDSYAVTGTLQGFAITSFNGVAAARLYDGTSTTVKTFDPGALATPLASASNACNRQDGVMVYQKGQVGSTYVGFLDCVAQPTATDYLKIRSNILTAPDISGTACVSGGNLNPPPSGSGHCDFFLQGDSGAFPADVCASGENFDFPANTGQLGSVQSVPISWETGDAQGEHSALLGFAFLDSTSGQFGAWVDLQRNNDGDKSCGRQVPFTTAGAVSQICSWRNPVDKLDYVIGGSQTSGSRIWQLVIDPQFSGPSLGNINGVDGPPHVTINTIRQLPSPYDRLSAVACGRMGTSVLAMTTSGTVTRIHGGTGFFGGQIIADWSVPSTSTARALAVSGDGLWCAYLATSTTINVCDARTGTTTGTLAKPTGTIVEMRLDDTGQYLYIATGGAINRYNLQTQGATTAIPVAPGTSCVDANGKPAPATGDASQTCTNVNPDGSAPTATTTATPSATGLFGNPAGYDLTGGSDPIKGGLVLTLFFVLGMAAVGSTMIGNTPQTRIWGAGLGAVLGFVLLVFFGNVPPIITFLVVLLAAAGIGFRVRNRNSSGDA